MPLPQRFLTKPQITKPAIISTMICAGSCSNQLASPCATPGPCAAAAGKAVSNTDKLATIFTAFDPFEG